MVAIEFEHISKLYRLGVTNSGKFREDLRHWWQKISHREPTYATENCIWALRDISLQIEQGEVLGIIGKNGHGKSTLLKLMSKITTPTEGIIRMRGRMASLLEVGTGFHNDMTGRENIYLNGTILGMSKAEISRKLDDIVAFSECEEFLDTPLKRYSSGMVVRLGFAVAAHLETDILIIDEVLAVGDAAFQKKAMQKIQQIAQDKSKTIIFVSHNMDMISQLCTRCLWLQNGQIGYLGDTQTCINTYLQSNA